MCSINFELNKLAEPNIDSAVMLDVLKDMSKEIAGIMFMVNIRNDGTNKVSSIYPIGDLTEYEQYVSSFNKWEDVINTVAIVEKYKEYVPIEYTLGDNAILLVNTLISFILDNGRTYSIVNCI